MVLVWHPAATSLFPYRWHPFTFALENAALPTVQIEHPSWFSEHRFTCTLNRPNRSTLCSSAWGLIFSTIFSCLRKWCPHRGRLWRALASILGIALMTTDWMGEQRWSWLNQICYVLLARFPPATHVQLQLSKIFFWIIFGGSALVTARAAGTVH